MAVLAASVWIDRGILFAPVATFASSVISLTPVIDALRHRRVPSLAAAAWAILGSVAVTYASIAAARVSEVDARTGVRVIAAVEAYGRDHGHPPPNFEALIPKYLESAPSTRSPLIGDIRYEAYNPYFVCVRWGWLGPEHVVLACFDEKGRRYHDESACDPTSGRE